jgi:DNA-binding transcriptional LysR family regulator
VKRLKDINWNQVYYFHEVARAGSMTLAAQTLGVSLPTVSEQIKKLEDLLEIELFHRSSRRIELTASGWELYHCSREMFAAGVRFLDKVSPSSIGGYAARVGVQETISDSVALEFLYRYEDAFNPFGSVRLQREIEPEGVAQRLLRGELDWGIVPEAPRHARLDHCRIGTIDIGFCCAREVFARFLTGDDVLRHLPLARTIGDKSINALVIHHLKPLGITPEEIIESDYREFTLGLARRGRCVAPVALNSSATTAFEDDLQVFTVGGPVTMQLYAVWAKNNERMAAIKEMRSLLPDYGQGSNISVPCSEPLPVVSGMK